MEDILVPFALFFSFAYAVVGVARAIADARTRRRLIDTKAAPDVVRALVQPLAAQREPYPSLRLGLVVGLVGLALLVVRLLPKSADDAVGSAMVLLAGGAGLLAHHVLARRLAERDAAAALGTDRGRGLRAPSPEAVAPAVPDATGRSVPAVADLELGRSP